MSAVKNKVTPVDYVKPKVNTFFERYGDTIHQFHHIIIANSLLGINRLYLFEMNKVIRWLTTLYSVWILAIVTTVLILNGICDGICGVFVRCVFIEYMLLIISSTFFMASKFENVFKNLSRFDDMLNIKHEYGKLSSTGRILYWILGTILYAIGEYFVIYMYAPSFRFPVLITSSAILAHDFENIFFISLQRIIYLRIKILKCHVQKLYNDDNEKHSKTEQDEVKDLSNNVTLHTTSLHRAYELLHKCANQLNSIMSLTMAVMITTAGMCTVVLMKIVLALMMDSPEKFWKNLEPNAEGMIAYCITRGLHFTKTVVAPCFYSSISTKEVFYIRNTVRGALNKITDDKIEYRKLEAFYLLTLDNDFSYTIWGVIILKLPLLLSYFSQCITYFIIVIQFSKIID